MAIIDRLIGERGDARSLVGSSRTNAIIDISDDAWEARPETLQGLVFQRIRLAGKHVKVDFVDCTFEDSEFIRLQSDAHFWAARNRWNNCTFDSLTLRDVISPMNTFRGCRFTEVSISHYKIHQTLFDRCTFERCEISGLRGQLISNQSHQNPELRNAQASILFRKCMLQDSLFEETFFDGIGFEDCSYAGVDARACDFTGIVSREKWWPEQKSDPFTSFLMNLLELIRKRCGASSVAYTAIQNYIIDYKTGRTRSDDFSACLYDGRVPDAELDQIAPELSKLMERYPF